MNKRQTRNTIERFARFEFAKQEGGKFAATCRFVIATWDDECDGEWDVTKAVIRVERITKIGIDAYIKQRRAK